jgi:hypothetical protein
LGVALGLGTVATLEQATVQAVTEPVAEARPLGRPASGVPDETGWRAGPPRAWRWTAGTTGVPVVVVRRSRRNSGRAVLGVCGDGALERLSVVSHRRRPLCWAPRLRDIAAMIARGAGPERGWKPCGHRSARWSTVASSRDGTLAPASWVSGEVAAPARRGALARRGANVRGPTPQA